MTRAGCACSCAAVGMLQLLSSLQLVICHLSGLVISEAGSQQTGPGAGSRGHGCKSDLALRTLQAGGEMPRT